MFDKITFSNILKNIQDTYSSQEEFANKSKVGRTYLSSYINQKKEIPPKETILKKLANASNGVTTYKELLYICDFLDFQEMLFYNVLTTTFNKRVHLLKDMEINSDIIRSIYLYFFDSGIDINKIINENKLTESQIKVLTNFVNDVLKDVKNNYTYISNIVDNAYNFEYQKKCRDVFVNLPIYILENKSLIDTKTSKLFEVENNDCDYFACKVLDPFIHYSLPNNKYLIVQKGSSFENKKYFIIKKNNEYLIKQLIENDNNYILVSTTNENDIAVKKSDITIIGKIII